MTLTADVITHSSPALNNSGDVPAFIPVVHTRLNYSGLRPFWALGTSRSMMSPRLWAPCGLGKAAAAVPSCGRAGPVQAGLQEQRQSQALRSSAVEKGWGYGGRVLF